MENIIQLKRIPIKEIDQFAIMDQLSKLEIQLFKLNKTLTQKEEKVLHISNSDGIHFIDHKEIIQIKASGNYSIISLVNGKSIIVSKTLKYFESLLPSIQFLRPHHSYIVSKKQIAKISRSNGCNITMKNDQLVPISRSAKSNLFETLAIHNPA